MKLCDDCKFAEWKRTTNGRLHPDKTGQCKFEIRIPVLPLAFNWGYLNASPNIGGGYIERKRELRDHCPCWAPKNGPTTMTFRKVKL